SEPHAELFTELEVARREHEREQALRAPARLVRDAQTAARRAALGEHPGHVRNGDRSHAIEARLSGMHPSYWIGLLILHGARELGQDLADAARHLLAEQALEFVEHGVLRRDQLDLDQAARRHDQGADLNGRAMAEHARAAAQREQLARDGPAMARAER